MKSKGNSLDGHDFRGWKLNLSAPNLSVALSDERLHEGEHKDGQREEGMENSVIQ